MELLVVNPNTTESVTRRLHEHVSAIVGDEATVRSATATFGARYISDELSFAIGAHAALDAVAGDIAEHGVAEALLLGCFGDPGIDALRQLTGRPVVGLAEAAMCEAASYGRFAIVTGGAAWKPMLERLARALGWREALHAVHVVEATGAQLASDPKAAVDLLRGECLRASEGVDAVILGGAGLAGMAAKIESAMDVRLIDSVSAGARALVTAARRAGPATATGSRPITTVEWQGLSLPLLQRLR
ncbi:MAG: aspartate/glutamate racemase family protein [Caldimonas sp.]